MRRNTISRIDSTGTDTASLDSHRHRILLRISASGVFLLIVFIFAFFIHGYRQGTFSSPDSLKEYISRFGSQGPLILGIFQCMKVLVPVIPSFLGCAAGAILFGPKIGFLTNYISLCVGSFLAFFLAKKCGRPLLDDLFPGKKYQKMADWAAHSTSYTAVLIIILLQPILPDDFFCYLSGLSEMKTKKFFGIIILVRPWIILAYSLIFSLI